MKEGWWWGLDYLGVDSSVWLCGDPCESGRVTINSKVNYITKETEQLLE